MTFAVITMNHGVCCCSPPQNFALISSLKSYAQEKDLSMVANGVEELPPASLQSFIRGVKDGNPNFTGSVLTSFKSVDE